MRKRSQRPLDRAAVPRSPTGGSGGGADDGAAVVMYSSSNITQRDRMRERESLKLAVAAGS